MNQKQVLFDRRLKTHVLQKMAVVEQVATE